MFCGGFGSYGFWPFGSTGSGFMFLALGLRLLVFLSFIVLTVKLFKNYTNKSNNTLKILDERFAKGEINEEEYIKRRTILSQKN